MDTKNVFLKNSPAIAIVYLYFDPMVANVFKRRLPCKMSSCRIDFHAQRRREKSESENFSRKCV